MRKIVIAGIVYLFFIPLGKALAWRVDTSGIYVPPAPTIVSPKGETLYGSKITFSWLAVREDIPGYRICIGFHPDLASCVVLKDIHKTGPEGLYLSEDITIPAGALRGGGRRRFYWRMTSLGGEEFDWSEVGSFYVDFSSSLPVCEHSRPHGEKVISDPEEVIQFAWEKVPGAHQYALYIYKGSSSTSVYKGIRTYNTWCYDFKAKDFSFGERYSWVVKAYRGRVDETTRIWSRCCGGEFKLVEAEVRGTHRYKIVRLIGPADNFVARCRNVNLSWHPLSGVSEYELWWGESGGHKINKKITSQTTIALTDLTNGKRYWWRVKPADREWRERDETRHFTTEIIPSTPTIVWPLHGIKTIVSNPIFKWKAARYAASYKLELKIEGLSGQNVFRISRPDPYGGRGNEDDIISFPYRHELSSGKYVFLVKACNAYGCSGLHIVAFEVVELPEREFPTSPVPSVPSGGRGTPLIRTDSSPPNIKILSPKNNEKIKMPIIPATITVIAKVDDAGSPASGIDRVEFWFNGRKVIEKKKPSKGSRYSVKIGAIKEGWNKIMVKAYDRAGNHRSVGIRFYIEHVVKKPVIKKQTPIAPKVKPLPIKEK